MAPTMNPCDQCGTPQPVAGGRCSSCLGLADFDGDIGPGTRATVTRPGKDAGLVVQVVRRNSTSSGTQTVWDCLPVRGGQPVASGWRYFRSGELDPGS